MATTVQVTFDSANPAALGAFWAELLGYIEHPPPEGFESWDDALEAWNVPADQRDSLYVIIDPDGAGPRLLFQKVPEPKSVKNRVHLDVNVGQGIKDPADKRATVDAAVPRAVALGATKVETFDPPGDYWVVMTDPEGNEFCLQ